MPKVAHVALACVFLGTTVYAADPAPINTRVRVVRNQPPGVVEIFVDVPPHEDNRGFTVKALCGEWEERVSERQLDGKQSEGPFHPVVFKSLSDCHYTITAQLIGPGDRIRAHAQPRLARIGSGSTEDEQDSLVGATGPAFPLP
jgi:hypothetical protein